MIDLENGLSPNLVRLPRVKLPTSIEAAQIELLSISRKPENKIAKDNLALG